MRSKQWILPLFNLMIVFFQSITSSAGNLTNTYSLKKTGLVIIGHNDFAGFDLTSKEIGISLSSAGYSNTVLAFNEKNPSKAHTKGEPLLAIKKELNRFFSYDSAQGIIILMGHSWMDNKNMEDFPNTVQVGMYLNKNSRFYMPSFARIVKQEKKPDMQLKLFAPTCFGNAVHEVSFENKNVCSLGYADRETYWEDDKLSQVDVDIFSNIINKDFDFDKDGKASLLDSFMILSEHNKSVGDESDLKKGGIFNSLATMSLSSMEYAQKILGKENIYETFTGFQDDQGIDGVLAKLQDSIFSCDDINLDLDPEFSPTLQVALIKGYCSKTISKGVLEPLKSLNPIIEDIPQRTAYNLTADEFARLPLGFQNAFKIIARNASAHSASARAIILSSLKKISNSRVSWEDLVAKYELCLAQANCSLSPIQHDLLKLKAEIRSQIEAIKKKTYLFKKAFVVLQKFKMLSQAIKVGSLEQVEKLKQLMGCELEGM